MTTAVRFPYNPTVVGQQSSEMLLPYLPITLIHDQQTVTTIGLLDSGAMVNVMPYQTGLALGLQWDKQTTSVALTGNLGRVPARGVVLQGQVESFEPVTLAFAWTQAPDVPLILGQVNFFLEYDLCFFRAEQAFELKRQDK